MNGSCEMGLMYYWLDRFLKDRRDGRPNSARRISRLSTGFLLTLALGLAASSAGAQTTTDDPTAMGFEEEIPPAPQEEYKPPANATPAQKRKALFTPSSQSAKTAPQSVKMANPERHEPYARWNRLAITLGFGIGSASMSSFHEGVDTMTQTLMSSNPGIKFEGEMKSNFQVSGEISFRYYFPYYILGQVGFGAIYNKASLTGTNGGFEQAIDNYNVLMEVPILIGGYYPLVDRIYLYGAMGPSLLFFSRAFTDPGVDFEADNGVGMHVLGGADFMLAEHFGLGLELRYRMLKTKDLKLKGTNMMVTPATLGGQGNRTYDLDFSGVTMLLNLRIFAM